MSNSHIRVLSGTYRNKSVAGMCFELVEQITTTGKNSFVKVKNGGTFPNMPETIRVNVTGTQDYEFVTQGVAVGVKGSVVKIEGVLRTQNKRWVIDEARTLVMYSNKR
jgi:hypothetical protein